MAKQPMKRWVIAPALLASALLQAAEFEHSGDVGAEWREYVQDAQWDTPTTDQAQRQLSITAEPELAWSINDGEQLVVFKPFVRLDNEDKRRTHADIRELSWLTYGDDWEIKAGISKVYWGVTESQHLVDIVNQTDFVEAPDGEEKLGQPMIKLSLVRDWGLVDAFVLPGFRERTFPDTEGRLRPGLKVDINSAAYQSSDKEKHIDLALRWSHTLDDYDVGLSWFRGTSRDPLLIPTGASLANPQPTALSPFYALINQWGVDVQATLDSWLWKLEGIYRSFDKEVKDDYRRFNVEDYSALTAGFEYTYYGVMDRDWDLGVLTEYQYDSRDDARLATGQNDVFVGGRLALNDADSSEVLFGISQDLDNSSTRGFVLEGDTRVGESIKLSLDLFLMDSNQTDNLSYQFRKDDYVQLGVNYYY